uniref:Uncharacterized protein n=1 Tax=Arundo donax TaxID=35708 RepID=A0A0A9FEY3_ARUDO
MGMIMGAFGYDRPRECRHHCYKPRPHYKPNLSKKVGAPTAPAVAPPVVAASLEPPLSAFHPEVASVGHEAVEDHHRQFEAVGRQPQVEAARGQTALVQPITHTDLFQVVEDGLRPIRDTLASMEGRIGRVEDGVTIPEQHINSSSLSQIAAPSSSLAPSLQATTPAPSSFPSLGQGQASAGHADNPSVLTQPVRARLSPFSRFPWYQRK